MARPSVTAQTMRKQARRLLDAARRTADHEKRGKLLAKALNLAQLAEVTEYAKAKAREKF